MITNFFIPELNNHDVQELWFQQDGATCHTAHTTIDLLKDTFGDRLISRFGPVNWPPRSCDLTLLDYFLWGYVKSLVYTDKPQMLDHLEDNIRRVIADIRPQMLEKVIENWTSRLDYIRASRGSPKPEIIFKMECHKIIFRIKKIHGHLTGWALDWFQVLGSRVVEDKATDYVHLKQALSEQFPVVRNRSELEARFFASFQKHNQKPSDFVYDLLKIHKILKHEMTEEKLIDHFISRLEPQILDYVEVRHPQTPSNLLQIIDKYEEMFLNRKIRGSSWEFRDTNPSENNRFSNRNRQENWRETRGNNRYADNSRPRREFNRFESQGVADNRRIDGRCRGGQSDH
ncbi:uncharacterized protein TNCV_2956211 [Trichonephila clavipes]|nr:uncharacterized protein TNCV_2956211 [Trichonephila clavipes]